MATTQSNSTSSAPGTVRISSTPGICGGKPCIAGTRIRVQDIHVWHELQGRSADEIVSQFPQLTMADVYAALSYFWDRRDEIERQMTDAEEFVAALKDRSTSPLQRKLSTANGAGDSVSSG